MKWIAGLVGLVALVFSFGDIAAVQRSGLEVHEWGTFTSMQGQNGAVLEGLHHEEEELPSFVHDLRSGAEPRTSSRGKGMQRTTRVTQKMETPVIYFYADKKMSVDVKVTFKNGIVSQWFPAANHEALHYSGAAIDMAEVAQSSISWHVDLVPRRHSAPSGIPRVGGDDPWAFAREVKAAYVKTNGGEAEHYLFYRGLGAQKLPVRIESRRDGKTLVINASPHLMPAAFLLEYGPRGARWVNVGAVTGEGSKIANLGAVPLRAGNQVVSELRAQVQRALVRSGLFEDEARAMVRTWSRSWFASEGTRLIYVLPRELTDDLLPIEITPRPDRLVRTLVGRLEFIPPAVAADVERAVRDRFSRHGKLRKASVARLDRLGRFLEPHLRNVLALSTNRRAKRNAATMLKRIQARGR